MLFNGSDLTEYIKIKSITGRGIINAEVESMDNPKKGARFKKRRVPPRNIGIEANIIAKNRKELRNKIETLNGILSVNEPVPVSFPDEPNRTYYGVPAQTGEGDEFPFMHKGEMTIICPDPNKFGDEQTESIATTKTTVQVSGQANTPWTSKTTFGADADQFILEANNGLYVQLDYSFVTGDVLEIDYKYRRVTLNGDLLMTPISLQTHWMPLNPGYMQMRASHETEISYSERYY